MKVFFSALLFVTAAAETGCNIADVLKASKQKEAAKLEGEGCDIGGDCGAKKVEEAKEKQPEEKQPEVKKPRAKKPMPVLPEGHRVHHVKTDEEIQEHAKNADLTIVKFFATWCGPCRGMAVPYAKMSMEEGNSKIAFLEVDVDEARHLAEKYQIRSMPMIRVFDKEGNVVKQLDGKMRKFQSMEQLKEGLYMLQQLQSEQQQKAVLKQAGEMAKKLQKDIESLEKQDALAKKLLFLGKMKPKVAGLIGQELYNAQKKYHAFKHAAGEDKPDEKQNSEKKPKKGKKKN